MDRFPGLASLPRVAIRDRVTPIERLDARGKQLWAKRDDLNAPRFGGNKVRSLELLLGGLQSGARVSTIGARGSTHALTTATWAKTIGARTFVAVWPQEMNPVAARVAAALSDRAVVRRVPHALAAVAWLWWRERRGDHVVPAGGTSPLGILGHVNAAMELAKQLEAGECPTPAAIVLPLGTGGTMAGLALGLAIAGVNTTLIGARVVPRIIGRSGRVRRLAEATRRLIERVTGERITNHLPPLMVRHDVYGGAYGRPLDPSRARPEAGTALGLDPTYSAKAFAAAATVPINGPVLFWMTFDARWLAGIDADG